MLRTRAGAGMRLSIVIAVAAVTGLFGVSTASAHAGGSNCIGEMVKVGSTYEGACTFPFQGYPVGMAAVYRPSTVDPNPRFGEVHAEILLKPAFGTPQHLSMECYSPEANAEGVIPKESGEHRCLKEVETPQVGEPFTLVEPIPTEIVAMQCAGHSHSLSSSFHPASGMFACWSTNEAREDLEADHVFEEMGF